MISSVAQLCEVDFRYYEQVIPHPFHAFNSAAFAQLNAHKCEQVYAFLFKDTKYRLGLLAGVRDGWLLSPFSAPFGGFSFIKSSVHLSAIESAVELTEQFAREKQLKGIRLVLPPLIYNRVFLSKLINVFYRFDYKVFNMDLDFYIELQHEVPYEDRIWKNARCNLREAFEQHFEVCLCQNLEDQKQVYEIICNNRRVKGRPMYMSFEEILQTAAIVPLSFFLVTKQKEPVASAIVYQLAPDMPYVAFWGDVPGFSLGRPMNFMSYHLVKYYQKLGMHYLHFGISSEDSKPNYGLSEFKESIGCTITPKLSFEKLLG
jgi:hypothetical protein